MWFWHQNQGVLPFFQTSETTKNTKALGMDSIGATIAKLAHTKFRITDDFPSARSHTRVQ